MFISFHDLRTNWECIPFQTLYRSIFVLNISKSWLFSSKHLQSDEKKNKSKLQTKAALFISKLQLHPKFAQILQYKEKQGTLIMLHYILTDRQ